MSEQPQALPLRTQIAQYWIHDIESVGIKSITYRAEEMRLNQRVWLQEFFPADTARRHLTSEEAYTVYAHPADRESFDIDKAAFISVHEVFTALEHPALPVLIKSFEASGTHYAAYRYRDDLKPLASRLQSGRALSEEKVTQLARSLLGALERLNERGIQPKTLDVDTVWVGRDGSGVFPGTTEWEPQTTEMSEMIGRLGVVLHAALTGTVANRGSVLLPLEPTPQCSAAICGLINRMISDDAGKRPAHFSEVRALLGSCRVVPGMELPESCVEKSDFLPKAARIAALSAVLFFALYVFVFQSDKVRPEELTWFDVTRYYIAASMGSSEAQWALAEMYDKGLYFDVDEDAALYWFEKAAHSGSVKDRTDYAYELYSRGKYDQAFEWMHKAALEGSAYAQNALGSFYSTGKGTSADGKAAVEWYRKAAAQNYSDAYYSLGWAYLYGNGVGKDAGTAAEWFRRGARQGDSRAEYAMGYMYANGIGVNRDDVAAFEWYLKAAEQGEKLAPYYLALSYEYAKGTPQNLEQALHWYQIAGEGDDHAKKRAGIVTRKIAMKEDAAQQTGSQYFAATEYEYTYQNIEKALSFYRQAARKGNVDAQNRLGDLYRQGSKVAQDYKEAARWYEMAAIQGSVVAMTNLAYMAEKGLGAGVNIDHAKYWYRMAEQQGDVQAADNLKRLNANGEKVVFAGSPSQSAMLLNLNAQESYRSKYTAAKQHKAFAQSPSGAWAWRSTRSSAYTAQKLALERCNRNARSDTCVVVNVDGTWLTNPINQYALDATAHRYRAEERYIFSRKAMNSYSRKYTQAKGHRAFAQSASGTWTWVSNRSSAKKAASDALASCTKKLKNADEKCSVINLDGEWQVD